MDFKNKILNVIAIDRVLNIKFYLILVLICNINFAQNANRKFESFKETNNSIEITVSDGQYLLKTYSEYIIETTFLPKGEAINTNSHALVLTPISGISKITEDKNTITYATTGLIAKIQKSPFQISYLYNGKQFLSEKNGYTKVNDSTETINFNIDSTEKLYGGGARALGMNTVEIDYNFTTEQVTATKPKPN